MPRRAILLLKTELQVEIKKSMYLKYISISRLITTAAIMIFFFCKENRPISLYAPKLTAMLPMIISRYLGLL